MRKLRTSDLPALCRSLKKLGLKEEFKKVAQEADGLEDVWDRGFEFVWKLFDVATEVEGEGAVYEFLAGPFEMTAQEVAELDLEILIDNCKQLAAENNLGAFFKSAAKLMK
jgi:hypothetical protein